MELTLNGNVYIGTKVDVAAGATYINRKVEAGAVYYESGMEEAVNEDGSSLIRQLAGLARDGGSVSSAEPAVAVDSDLLARRLEPFFGMSFRGRNATKTDYLPMLTEDIQAFSVPKDIARIANMLYNSRSMINRPSSFRQWHRMFCDICGRTYKQYDQCKVDDYELLKPRFYYLDF